MLTSQRKSLLLDRLRSEGRLLAGPLAAELGVSEDTVRRDLRELAAEGRLMRVHGGALPLSPTHVPVGARAALEMAEKQRLARVGAGLVQPGMVVIMDGGTTHDTLIRALPADLRAVVVTHSPAIVAAFAGFAGVEVQLIGGRILRHSMVAVGAATQRAYAGVRADLCFLGVTGIEAARGLTTEDAEEAVVKETMLGAAAETVVLATPGKIGAVSRWTVGLVASVTHLVTVAGRPDWLPPAVAHHRA
ncbi:MAG: DeoR/GlpR family DNA-binding transcription regulator [Rhodobacteraceae bacterium]|jgi:DeoR/GlpR family transcriptional regulator of sugar metabolism|nr:DeoR/GlpR family DNA-binding transcription regulator [Paracoccaceae bacterium]